MEVTREEFLRLWKSEQGGAALQMWANRIKEAEGVEALNAAYVQFSRYFEQDANTLMAIIWAAAAGANQRVDEIFATPRWRSELCGFYRNFFAIKMQSGGIFAPPHPLGLMTDHKDMLYAAVGRWLDRHPEAHEEFGFKPK